MTFPRLIRPLKFYAVLPDANWIIRMVKAGVHTVQLRNKTLQGKALYQEIERCVAACRHSKTQLFINDHWQMAIDAGAYGIHLGQEDMDTANFTAIAQAGLRLGLSTHSISELDRALSLAPSYVASGAIFPTATKQMPTEPQGLEKLRAYVQQAGNTPVVAIGGIDLNNAQAVLATGVASLAVVRAITESDNPELVVKAFQALWQ
ncbi:MAG: thiamine phosphate synthase [Alysiella sp.]|uniref:thiamine phosphate synthase n=1 Tax=Alysiella sp. TaxID=1872483 RepID=UPI0026DB439E|nr:thiamine phosphate synthase [Alysiella sp.]MDO4433377.1 thiamine phosphate synthase [Alysiella sp.]